MYPDNSITNLANPNNSQRSVSEVRMEAKLDEILRLLRELLARTEHKETADKGWKR